jgi:hypothetical protein
MMVPHHCDVTFGVREQEKHFVPHYKNDSAPSVEPTQRYTTRTAYQSHVSCTSLIPSVLACWCRLPEHNCAESSPGIWPQISFSEWDKICDQMVVQDRLILAGGPRRIEAFPRSYPQRGAVRSRLSSIRCRDHHNDGIPPLFFLQIATCLSEPNRVALL